MKGLASFNDSPNEKSYTHARARMQPHTALHKQTRGATFQVSHRLVRFTFFVMVISLAKYYLLDFFHLDKPMGSIDKDFVPL